MRRRSGTRVLAAVLFTDIVDSTAVAGQVGDARWKELISRHHSIVRRELKRFGGKELDTAGDGFYASFTEPAAAVRCACAATESIRQLGIEIRTGVHFGECEQVGEKLGGIAVAVGARVMSLGGPGDVLVTGTTRELVAGAGFGFVDRGHHSLKGVDGEWQVFSVSEVDGVPRPGPAEQEEAEQRLAEIRPVALRPRTWLVVGGIVLLIAGAALFVALRRGDERPPVLARIPPNSVGRIDPSTNAIGAWLSVGSKPTAVTVGGGAVWIASLEDGTLARVDLESRGVETLSTGGHPAAISLDEAGFVWVLNAFEATVVRVDPARKILDRTIELSTGTKDLAAGLGALWVTNASDGTLTRIDLVTSSIHEIELVGIGMPDGVAVGEEVIWVAGSDGVVKVDPRSLEVIRSWALRFPAGRIVASGGVAWATHLADDQVTKIDEVTGPSMVIAVGNGPLDLAVGSAAVWVTNSLDGTVSRIDPETNEVTEIRVGSSPEGVALGDGSVWVAVHSL